MTISDLLFTFLTLRPNSILHLKNLQGTPLPSDSDQGTPAGLPEPNGWHHKGSWKRICVCVRVCACGLLCFHLLVFFLKYESC